MVKCNVEGCNAVVNFADLVRHLKGHISAGIKIKCPAQGCGRVVSKKSTFTAHLSVKHGMLNKNTIDGNLLVDCRSGNSTESNVHKSAVENSNCSTDTNAIVAAETDDVSAANNVDRNMFMHTFALFMLKLQCRCNVPASTVELVANEVYNLHQQNVDTCLQAVKSRLTGQNVNCRISEEVVNVFKQEDLFTAALNSVDGLLRSQHKRKVFYKRNFRYVEPLQKNLGENQYGKPRVYQYISLHQTLESLLQDESVAHYVNSYNSCDCDHGMFNLSTDLCDGRVYQCIRETVTHVPFIQIMLYQDAFEVVNPIGSARKIHKIVAVYMALGNLPPHLRMNMDNLHLVLCHETDLNYFGQNMIFHCLVEELQDLECNGIQVNGQVYEVRLICFLGDNLGSHWLGGFNTNFSVSAYVCRYCLVHRVADSGSLCKTGELRTPENYNDAVNRLSDVMRSVHGIVQNSVLHCLKYYHVCLPGLPPCLGHDLFEGVVQFDLSLILKQLCNSGTGYCTIKQLNRSVKQFQFLGADANDKPNSVSDGKTVGGNAIQVWCLLRLLPLFLYGSADVHDDAWTMLMLLREIVELVCAPKISVAQMLYLNRLVQQYVEDRSKLFSSVPLRPKHHYLLHYPWLTQMFGPLIRVWTMRMESKHYFFKRCARSCRNFINITKTLSETHQLSQAYLSSGSVVCDYVELGCDTCDFDELFSCDIVTAVRSCQKLISPLCCSSSVTVSGTKYGKGSYVVLHCRESQPIFGKVLMCLSDSAGVPAVVTEECTSEKKSVIGIISCAGWQ